MRVGICKVIFKEWNEWLFFWFVRFDYYLIEWVVIRVDIYIVYLSIVLS